MKEVKRYDAVHLRYEESNIRYGEGCEVEVVADYDYDALMAERNELLAALEGLDEAYCDAGPDMTKEQRVFGRKSLIAARAIIAKCRGGV